MLRQGRRDLSPEALEALVGCFSPIKAEDDSGLDNDTIFVRTRAYAELADRQRARTNTVLLGRKGDGKTALIRRLAHDLESGRLTGDKVNAVQVFEQIDMEDSYFAELVAQFKNIRDAIHLRHKQIPDDLIAKKIWTKYLQLVALRIALRRGLELSGRPGFSIPESEFEEVEALILRELDAAELHVNTAEVSQGFLTYLRKILRRLSVGDNDVADALQDDQQSSDPMSMLQDIPRGAAEAAMLVAAHPIHVTIALDRFDDFVDRLVSDDLSSTRQLRRHFLHGLIAALYQIQRQSAFGWLRLVASLPEDLVVDLDFRELAAHQRLLFVRLEWTLDDLRDLLDSRVSSVVQGTTWSDLFPFQISSSNKRIQAKETAAQYLIRHTTRRPRELMTHASNLFQQLRLEKKPLDSRSINKIIAKTNGEIVQNQVLPEWRSVLPSLSIAFERLHRQQIGTVIDYATLRATGIGNILIPPTRHTQRSLTEEARSFMALSSLFRVGVIGFRVSRSTPREGYLHQGDGDYVRYVFAFSPLKEPIRDVCAMLLDPRLGMIVETDAGKAERAFLSEGRHGLYELRPCLCPMFFESLAAEHQFSYIVGELEST